MFYYFLLGIIVGLLFSILDFVILIYFRRTIEQKSKIIETQIANAGPRPQGYVIEPEDEADEFRAEVIEQNQKEGKDTRLQDLL